MYKPQQVQFQSDVNNRFLSQPNKGLMFGSDGQTYSGGATGAAGTFPTPRDAADYWDNDNMYQEMLKQMQSLPVGSHERDALRNRMEQYRTNKFASAMPVSSAGILPSTKATTPAVAPTPTPPAPTPTPPAPTTPPAPSSGTSPQFGSQASSTLAPQFSSTASNTPASNTPASNTPASNTPASTQPGNGLWDSLKEVIILIQEHDASRRDHVNSQGQYQGQTSEWELVNRQLHKRLNDLNKAIGNAQTEKMRSEANTKREKIKTDKEAAKTTENAEKTKIAEQQKIASKSAQQVYIETLKNNVTKKAGALLAEGEITPEEFDLLTQDPGRGQEVINRMYATKFGVNAAGQDSAGNTPGATPEENQTIKMWDKLEGPSKQQQQQEPNLGFTFTTPEEAAKPLPETNKIPELHKAPPPTTSPFADKPVEYPTFTRPSTPPKTTNSLASPTIDITKSQLNQMYKAGHIDEATFRRGMSDPYSYGKTIETIYDDYVKRYKAQDPNQPFPNNSA